MTGRGSGPATPSGSTGSPCSAPAPSGRPASAWTDRAATVRAGGSAAIAKAVVERWFTSEFLAAHPDVRAAHEAMVAAISAFAEPEPSMGDVPALGSTPTAYSSNPGWLPAPLTAHWPVVSRFRPRSSGPHQPVERTAMLSGRTAVIAGGAHGIGLAALTGRKPPDRRTHRRVATLLRSSSVPIRCRINAPTFPRSNYAWPHG